MRSLRIFALAHGNDLADGLIAGSEVGVFHLRAVSTVVGRNIRVWDAKGRILKVFYNSNCLEANSCKCLSEDRLILRKYFGKSVENNDIDNGKYLNSNYSLGNNSPESQVELKQDLDNDDFLELQYQVPLNDGTGHWSCNNSENTESKGNNCFFDAVCQQCSEYEPNKLRLLTADVIRRQGLILEEGFPQFEGSGCFLLGGAKYNGKSSRDAGNLIDNSQGTRGHGHVARAHPRGHASHQSATGDMESIENYSRSASRENPKSGWLSREDQDMSMHRLLIRQECQEGMERLNRGRETRIVLKLFPQFEIRMGLWANGEMFSGPLIAEFVTILLQHYDGQQSEPDADVQIFTCYPMAPKEGQDKISLPKQLKTKIIQSSSSSDDEDEPSKKMLKMNQ